MSTEEVATTQDQVDVRADEDSDVETRVAGLDNSVASPAEASGAVPARVETHGFDPISAVLGALACLAGALVVTGTVDPLGADDAGAWIAVAVIVIGVALLPWGGRRTS